MMVSARIALLSAMLSLFLALVSRGAAAADLADDRDIRALIEDANLDSHFLDNEEFLAPLPADLYMKAGHRGGGGGPDDHHHSHAPTASPSSTPAHLTTMPSIAHSSMTTMAPNPVSMETMSPTMSSSVSPTSGSTLPPSNPSPSNPTPVIPETATLAPTTVAGTATSGAWRVHEFTAAVTAVGAMVAGAAAMLA